MSFWTPDRLSIFWLDGCLYSGISGFFCFKGCARPVTEEMLDCLRVGRWRSTSDFTCYLWLLREVNCAGSCWWLFVRGCNSRGCWGWESFIKVGCDGGIEMNLGARFYCWPVVVGSDLMLPRWFSEWGCCLGSFCWTRRTGWSCPPSIESTMLLLWPAAMGGFADLPDWCEFYCYIMGTKVMNSYCFIVFFFVFLVAEKICLLGWSKADDF